MYRKCGKTGMLLEKKEEEKIHSLIEIFEDAYYNIHSLNILNVECFKQTTELDG